MGGMLGKVVAAGTRPSTRTFIISLFLTISCFISFLFLEGAIVKASTTKPGTPPSALQILDTRYGYTVEQVRDLFASWGPDGRRLYVVIAVIDTVVFPASYATATAYAVAYLAAAVQGILPWAVLGIYHPWILALLDLFENTGNMTLLSLYEKGEGPSDRFELAVKVVSTLNQIKWSWLSLGALIIFLELLVLAWVGMGFSSFVPPSSSTSSRGGRKDD